MDRPAAPDPARVERVGLDAWLVRVQGAEQAASLARWLQAAALPGAEVVPAARSVLVDGVADPEVLHDLVGRWRPEDGTVGEGPLVEVPVRYDGPDLAEVACRWGIEVEEVVARHTSIDFMATFTGFAPGFSYLSGLPQGWEVPRRPSPRARVEAGSVGLADRWCGIYPTASPGGWALIGRTELAVWDLEREAGPALLVPGTRVRFVAA